MENNNGGSGSSARGSVAVAFLIGAVAGGVAALLLAPQTKLGDGLATVIEDLHDRAENIRGTVSEARTAYRDEMEKRRTPLHNTAGESEKI